MEPKLSNKYIAADDVYDIESMTDEEYQDTLDRFEEELHRFIGKDKDVEYPQKPLTYSYGEDRTDPMDRDSYNHLLNGDNK